MNLNDLIGFFKFRTTLNNLIFFFFKKGTSLEPRLKLEHSHDKSSDLETSKIINQQARLIDELMSTNRELIERVIIKIILIKIKNPEFYYKYRFIFLKNFYIYCFKLFS